MVRLLYYFFELIVVMLVGRALSRGLHSMFGSDGTWSDRRETPPSPESASAAAGKTVRDPICGMFVSTELSHRMTVEGRTLHFCSDECLERYREERKSGVRG